jgi:hypothetical protein
VNDGILVEVVHGSHDAILEFLFGGDTDVAEDGAGELGKKALNEIEPGAVFRCEGEFEAAGGLTGEPGYARFRRGRSCCSQRSFGAG